MNEYIYFLNWQSRQYVLVYHTFFKRNTHYFDCPLPWERPTSPLPSELALYLVMTYVVMSESLIQRSAPWTTVRIAEINRTKFAWLTCTRLKILKVFIGETAYLCLTIPCGDQIKHIVLTPKSNCNWFWAHFSLSCVTKYVWNNSNFFKVVRLQTAWTDSKQL